MLDWANTRKTEPRDVSEVVDFAAFDHLKKTLLDLNKF